jgi:hypothetical protein
MNCRRYRLSVDDVREPTSPDCIVVRNSSDAVALLETCGCPYSISFDHDLGSNDTAMTVAKKLVEMDLDAEGGFIPDDFAFHVHSANPVGSKNIAGLLNSYLQHRPTRR